MKKYFWQLVFITVCLVAPQIHAQEEKSEDLEKKLANPVSDVTTLPLQMNFNFRSYNDNVSNTVFNIQPVFSGKIGDHPFITRIIMPFINAPTDDTGMTAISGFGDLIYQGFWAPAPAGGSLIWALGWVLQAPTGSDARIASGKWGAGPSVVLISQDDKLTYGALIYQNWSFAGNSNRQDINMLTIQPITSYRLGAGWSVGPFNNIIYDATIDDSDKWTVPLGLSITKLIPRRAVPINTTFGVFGNIIRPDDAPDWSMKVQMNFVF
jgi:hypothetical protein